MTELKKVCKLCTALLLKAQRGSTRIGLRFPYIGANWGGWLTPCPGRLTPGDDPEPIA
jgi:hypothetical protein